MANAQENDKDWEFLYAPSRWSHRMGPQEVINWHIDASEKGSKSSHWTLDCEVDISYGDTPNQKLDVFHKKGAPKKGCPIFVYFHGGYWQTPQVKLLPALYFCIDADPSKPLNTRKTVRQNASFAAVPLCDAGATVVAVGYDLTPNVTLGTIVSQIEQAVYFVIKLAKERESRGVYLSGHSAGAHLAAMMLKSSFSELDAFDQEMIKGAVLVSGVFDLVPLTRTSNNDALQLSVEDAPSLSPFSCLEEISHHSGHRHIIVAVGEYDSPEFRRQSGEMEKGLRDHGVKTTYLDIPDVDHFSVINKMVDPGYKLIKECIRLMGL